MRVIEMGDSIQRECNADVQGNFTLLARVGYDR